MAMKNVQFFCCYCCLSNLMEGAALMCILRVTAPAIIQYHMLRESIGFHILFLADPLDTRFGL